MDEKKLLKIEKETVCSERTKKRIKDFNHLNTLAKKGQIVFAGDSIVEFWPTDELFTELKEKSKLDIYNRGIDGDVSNRLLERIESNVCVLDPKVFYLLIGTNDFLFKFPTEYTLENIKKMIEAVNLHCTDCKIFIQSLCPVNKDVNKQMVSSRKNKKIIALNDEIRRLALNLGCVYVDVFDELLDETDVFSEEYTYDGLHPSIPGYIKLSKIATEAILSNFNPMSSPAAPDVEKIIAEISE